jgi:molybdate/tungstate transport system ATP-binding protein
MLKLKGINKTLGAMSMTDINLEIEAGQYLVLLGPSGVGKTVLLEIIAGLIRPDSGKVIWKENDITSAPPEERRFSIVYQDHALFPHLTVAGNITYGLKHCRIKPAEQKKRLHNLSEMLGIESLLHRYPAKLSGGEKQRVALGRALAVEPGLLLLDEPLSALDVNAKVRLRNELTQIAKEIGSTVLHVTHDPEDAMVLADKVAVMLDHRIKQVAEPVDLFRHPSDAEVAEFLGMKNILPVTSVREDGCLVCGEMVYASSADDRTSHIWLGPEEILLSAEPFDSSALNQFECTVINCQPFNSLLAVEIAKGNLTLTALVTHSSAKQLNPENGKTIYATFKSSAVHCF